MSFESTRTISVNFFEDKRRLISDLTRVKGDEERSKMGQMVNSTNFDNFYKIKLSQ